MRRQYTGGLSLPRGRLRAQHRADLGLSMMITLYPDIVRAARRAIPARCGYFGRAEK